MSRNPKDVSRKLQRAATEQVQERIDNLPDLRQGARNSFERGYDVARGIFVTEDEYELMYYGRNRHEWQQFLRGEITREQYRANAIKRGRSVKANVERLKENNVRHKK